MLVSKKALLTCVAIDFNDKDHPSSKSFLADSKNINEQDKQDKQGPAKNQGGGTGK